MWDWAKGQWRAPRLSGPALQPKQTVFFVTEDPLRIQPSAARFSDTSTELAARRTGMSFQRTRLSADRTLMSVIRTSLSLISFGFTIYQFFERLLKDGTLEAGASHAARSFGRALVWLGVGTLIAGIIYHLEFMLDLRTERKRMKRNGTIYGESRFPASFALVAAVALLLIGLAAVASVTFHLGPFG